VSMGVSVGVIVSGSVSDDVCACVLLV
jgi:hypothetical protein